MHEQQRRFLRELLLVAIGEWFGVCVVVGVGFEAAYVISVVLLFLFCCIVLVDRANHGIEQGEYEDFEQFLVDHV